MSDILISTLFTIGGMFGVAALGARVQIVVTRKVIEAEHRKVMAQIDAESRVKRSESRLDRLHDTVSDMIAESDPDSFLIDPNTPRLAQRISKTQILLDNRIPTQAALNTAVNELGLTLRGWRDLPDSVEAFRAHARVVELARAVLRGETGRSIERTG